MLHMVAEVDWTRRNAKAFRSAWVFVCGVVSRERYGLGLRWPLHRSISAARSALALALALNPKTAAVKPTVAAGKIPPLGV